MKLKTLTTTAAPAAILLYLSGVPIATADEKARLLSVDENPAVITSADGRFHAKIHKDRIDFSLEYEGVESNVLQAHIHVENPGRNGPVTVFLCTNLGNTPAGATDRPCLPSPGMVEGSIVASDVLMAENVPAGDLDAVAQVLRDGAAYVNVHSADYPSGEIRGQVSPRKR